MTEKVHDRARQSYAPLRIVSCIGLTASSSLALPRMDNDSARQLSDFDHPLLQAPEFLKNWPAWAAWSAPTKRPLDLKRALAGASVTAPDTWAPYEYALRHLRRVAPPVPYKCPVPLGVGILVAPPLVFVD